MDPTFNKELKTMTARKDFAMNSKKKLIEQSEKEVSRRRRKHFWLWVRNSRPVMAAAIIFLGYLAFWGTQMLLDGGNGLIFVGWGAILVALLAAILQFMYAEKGYTIEDWAPRWLRGTKFGW